MAKRFKALLLAAVLVLTLVAAPSNSYAVDATTSATAAPAAPAPAPAPATPTAPKAPVSTTAPATPAAPVAQEFAIPTITRVLYYGTNGADVELLQKYLTKVGFALESDGKFGNLTLKAVKAFQTKAGLKVDGYVGQLTNKALYNAAGQTDVVTTASLVNDISAFKSGIGANGKWIITTLKDLVSKEELVLTGTFKNGKKDKVTGEDVIARKIGLYTQDEDRNVTARFKLTAPKLTIESPNASIQKGTFVGDIYVNAEGFQLVDMIVTGNVYYMTQAAKDTAKIDDKTKVSGEVALIEIIAGTDVTTSASLTYDNEVFASSIGANGPWIISVLKDMTFSEELFVKGDVMNTKGALQRKLAFYSQDEDRKVTRRFTVTAPKLTIESPNARIQGGIFKGDVYVSVDNFQLVNATVDGNIYFTTQSAKDTFKMDELSLVTGQKILTQLDAVVSPSLFRDEETLTKNLSKNGTWIIYAGNDVVSEKPLYLLGEFMNDGKFDRKIALYSQDEKRNVTRRFTLTAPMLVIASPSTRLEKGNFIGDIHVQSTNFKLNGAEVTGNIYVGANAKGFTMVKTKVTGNIVYASTFVMDAAVIDDLSTVSGTQGLR